VASHPIQLTSNFEKGSTPTVTSYTLKWISLASPPPPTHHSPLYWPTQKVFLVTWRACVIKSHHMIACPTTGACCYPALCCRFSSAAGISLFRRTWQLFEYFAEQEGLACYCYTWALTISMATVKFYWDVETEKPPWRCRWLGSRNVGKTENTARCHHSIAGIQLTGTLITSHQKTWMEYIVISSRPTRNIIQDCHLHLRVGGTFRPFKREETSTQQSHLIAGLIKLFGLTCSRCWSVLFVGYLPTVSQLLLFKVESRRHCTVGQPWRQSELTACAPFVERAPRDERRLESSNIT
jgi:hypothetical protein